MLANLLLISFEKNENLKSGWGLDITSYHRDGSTGNDVLAILDIVREKIAQKIKADKKQGELDLGKEGL